MHELQLYITIVRINVSARRIFVQNVHLFSYYLLQIFTSLNYSLICTRLLLFNFFANKQQFEIKLNLIRFIYLRFDADVDYYYY